MSALRIVETEVVIVGGGAAGTFAALCLHRAGIRPLLVSKGFVGKSGASIFAGNLVIAGRMLGNTRQQADDTAELLIKIHNNYLIDQNYARRCGAWIESAYYPELEEAGLYFRRNDQGNVVTNTGRVRCIAANHQGRSGILFMDLRRKQVRRAGIACLEETVATALLTDHEGRVVGLTALNQMTGDIFAVSAKAVILATGYADRLYTRSTATREMSADGIALAWRAGAELVNLEIQWWHTSDVRYPATWQRMRVYPNPILGSAHSARLYNVDGEVFFDQQIDAPIAFAPYTIQMKRLARQVLAGKATFDGGYETGFTHIPPQEVAAYSHYTAVFARLGKSVATDTLEAAPSAHYRQGGLLVDPETMATTVPGLYVAGGLGGHSNGLIGLVTYDGKVVAETVSRRLPELRPPVLPMAQAEAEAARLESLRRPLHSGGVTPVHIKKAIRAIMSEKMGFLKSEATMSAALADILRLREELVPAMGLRSTLPAANPGWLDAIDVINMLDVCELTIRSALQRKESRGPFYRTDFPMTDNENWLVKNILTPAPDGVRFRVEPYALPFLKPDFDCRNSLDVEW
jgi:succinate dehydrogenase/fumarate reductase flavoprotein subunit